jgi:hypothetical protein
MTTWPYLVRWQVHYVYKNAKNDNKQLWRVDKLNNNVMLDKLKVKGIRDRQGPWMKLHLTLHHILQSVLRLWHHRLMRWTMTLC